MGNESEIMKPVTRLIERLLIDDYDSVSGGETTKRATANRAAALGLITITDFWIIRGGVPGASASGVKPGTFVTTFRLTEKGSALRDELRRSIR